MSHETPNSRCQAFQATSTFSSRLMNLRPTPYMPSLLASNLLKFRWRPLIGLVCRLQRPAQARRRAARGSRMSNEEEAVVVSVARKQNASEAVGAAEAHQRKHVGHKQQGGRRQTAAASRAR